MPKEVNQHRTMLHEHMASYQVSVSNSLESPLASGTFVKFTTVVEGNPTKVFGILTAKHVLDNDDPDLHALCKAIMVEKATGRQFIVLAKLINEKLIGCTATFELFFAIAHKKGISSLHKFDPDLGFICLGFEGKMAEHPLLLNSKFYDLDVKEENDLIAARQSSIISGFYRGATTDAEIIDNIVPIGPYTGGDEQLAHNQRSNIYYWKIPYQKKLWINGASGSAFWRVIEKNNQTDISLGGTIVCLSPNKEKIHATSAIYLYQTFLPELKKACSEQLKS